MVSTVLEYLMIIQWVHYIRSFNGVHCIRVSHDHSMVSTVLKHCTITMIIIVNTLFKLPDEIVISFQTDSDLEYCLCQF